METNLDDSVIQKGKKLTSSSESIKKASGLTKLHHSFCQLLLMTLFSLLSFCSGDSQTFHFCNKGILSSALLMSGNGDGHKYLVVSAAVIVDMHDR